MGKRVVELKYKIYRITEAGTISDTFNNRMLNPNFEDWYDTMEEALADIQNSQYADNSYLILPCAITRCYFGEED